MAHHCKHFLIRCIDFRLGRPIFNYLDERGIFDDCDIAAIAGGVKDSKFLMDQLDLSISLHGITEAILCNHTDCGAYGGSAQFNSLEDEGEFHIGELKKARELVSVKYPSLSVKLLLGRMLSSGEFNLEEV
jgi:carbonic anhydrase